MKALFFSVTIVLILFVGTVSAGTFVSGSTGADGAFTPTANIQLQLPPDGIFNFTTVNIPSGVTVTFKKNAANTPIYMLAAGAVTIAGTIDVSGGSTTSSTDNQPGIGGPGGFNGGYGDVPGLSGGVGGQGLGPGGGAVTTNPSYPGGGGGGFGTAGSRGVSALGGPTYGNERLIPLLGGSGGGGLSIPGYLGYGGAGGGGAILIASSGNIIISNGTIKSYGGNGRPDGYGYNQTSGCGSGGAIKLMANTVSGTGSILAPGGCAGSFYSAGGSGRVRIEAFSNIFGSTTNPPYTYGLPGSIFAANIPILNITAIGGVNVPSNPAASYSTPDIGLPSTTTNPVAVVLSASYIPLNATITVSAIPQFGAATNVTTTLSGSDASSTATANVNVSTNSAAVIMAYTTFTLQTAMYWDGEKINKVRVASSVGKGSSAVYITESGKEIPATLLAGLMK